MRLSVARRLWLLAATEVVTASLLVTVSLAVLYDVERSARFVRAFAIPPIDAVGKALVRNAQVQDALARNLENDGSLDREMLDEHVRQLRALGGRYRADWAVKGNPTPIARHAFAKLEAENRLDLIEQEASALERYEEAVRGLGAAVPSAAVAATAQRLAETQAALRQLRSVSSDYLVHTQGTLEVEARRGRWTVLVLGVLGTLFAGVAAFRVRTAIAPRIRVLVDKVRRFREVGVHERLLDTGQDEIAVLANALDAGFTAIESRDRERERFLATAAHELKTPLAAMLGFAQAAQRRPDDLALRERALDIVQRHGTRLARLIDDVLLAARARSGELGVRPNRSDFVTIVRRVLDELEGAGVQHVIRLDVPASAPLLADDVLLAHAVWALFAYALAVSSVSDPIAVEVRSGAARTSVRATVRLRSDISREEIEHAVAPFGLLPFETDRPRIGVGLFLCREIARVHGGALTIEESPGGLTMVLEVPS